MSKWSKIEAKVAEFGVAELPLDARRKLARLLAGGVWEAEAGLLIAGSDYHQDVEIPREFWNEDALGNPEGTVWDGGYGDVVRADGSKLNYSHIVVRPALANPQAVIGTVPAKKQTGGRPPKWDYLPAFAHIAAIADKDGLIDEEGRPLNVSGIARLIAGFFSATVNDHPSDSDCRKHAAMIIKAIEAEALRRAAA